MEHMEKLYHIVGVSDKAKSAQLRVLPVAPKDPKPRQFTAHCLQRYEARGGWGERRLPALICNGLPYSDAHTPRH